MLRNFLIFSVKHGAPVVSAMRQYETRGDNALELLRRLVALDPARFNGRSGVVFFEDAPPPLEREWLDYELRFCSTVIQGQPSIYLPFPDVYTLRWPETRLTDGDALLCDLIVDEEPHLSEKAFWRGADTHASRRALVELAAEHRDILDCTFMSWNRQNPRLLDSPRFVSLWDHRQYKYLVECQGWGYSARLKWLIASGRPVFLVDRAPVEHWHEKLVPWVHFVPVRSDLSDLLAAHARIEASPELYAAIHQHARRFAHDHLRLDRQLAASLAAVQNLVSNPSP